MKPKRTILCVDDNEQLLSMRKVMLETRGYRVIACTTGEQALEEFQKGGVDLVLSDLVMPSMDGTELICQIKEMSPQTPAILFSGKITELQKMYAKSGRHGQFSKRIEELGFVRGTVYRWIDEYKTQVSHRKSKSGVIQAGENELSQLRQLSTQVAQNEAITRNSCGTGDDAHDSWDELAEPVRSEEPRTAGTVVLPFDTAEKRKKYMFQQAVRALQAGNVYTESLREEWDEVDQRVRQWLASFVVDNAVPARDVSQVQRQEQEN